MKLHYTRDQIESLAKYECAAMARDWLEQDAEIASLQREKDARIYYQDIVYKVCMFLDAIESRSVAAGEGVVCGTLETPSTEVQEAMDRLYQKSREHPRATQDSGEIEDVVAADKWRRSVLSKQDGTVGPYPYWHGWVIVDAYVAGLEAGRKEQDAAIEEMRVWKPLPAGSPLAEIFLQAEGYTSYLLSSALGEGGTSFASPAEKQ